MSEIKLGQLSGMRPLLVAVLLTLALLGPGSRAHAQPCKEGEMVASYVQLDVMYAVETDTGLPNEGFPAEDVLVELYDDATGEFIGDGIADPAGTVQIQSASDPNGCVAFGDYKAVVRTDASPNADLAGLYDVLDIPFTVVSPPTLPRDNQGNPFFDVNSAQDTGPFDLLEAPRTLRVNVIEIDEDGNDLGMKIPGAYVTAQGEDGMGNLTFRSATTSATGGFEGRAYIPLKIGEDFVYDLWASAPNFGTAYKVGVVPDPMKSSVETLRVLRGTIPVTFSFKDSMGAAFSPTSDPYQYVYARCETFVDSLNRFVEFEEIVDALSADPTKTSFLNVVSGDLDCEVTLYEEYFDPTLGKYVQFIVQSKFFEISVGGSSFSRNVTLEQSSSSVEVKAVDSQTGEVVDDQCLSFSVFPLDEDSSGANVSGGDFVDIAKGEQAKHTFELVQGVQYSIGVWPCFNDSSGGFDDNYVVPFDEVFITPESGQNDPVEFELAPLDAGVTVVLQDENGARVEGLVDLYSPPNFGQMADRSLRSTGPSDPAFDHWNGGPTSNGELRLGVVSGRRYLINAFPNLNFSDDFLPSPEQEVLLAPGEERVVVFTVRRPDHFVTVRPQLEGPLPSGNLIFLDCFASNRKGQSAYGFSDGFGEVTLGISSRKQRRKEIVYWRVGCNAVFESEDQEKYLFGTALYRATGDSGSIDLLLTQGPSYYEERCNEFANDHDQLITLQDGKSLVEIAKGTFGDAGVTKMCTTSGANFLFTNQEYPTITWDIEFFKNGEKVTSLTRPVRVWFPISLSTLSSLGATTSDLIAGSFSHAVKGWRRDAAVAVEVRNGITYLVVSVNHFSLLGALLDLTESEQRAVPTDLKVRGKRGKKVKFVWDAPDNADDDTPYTLQWVKLNRKSKAFEAGGNDIFDFGRAKAATIVGKTVAKKKLKNGTWRWRVKVQGGTNPTANQFKRKRR